MRFVLALIALCTLAAGQVSAPFVGLVRLNDSTVRPLHGVAGSFTLGEPLLAGVDALHFDGSDGWARCGDEVLKLDRAGRVLAGEPVDETGSVDEVAYIDGNELVIRRSGARLLLPFAVDRLERAGADYVALSGAEGRLLARLTEGREALFAMPEVAE
jgi:hypothetical protein